MLGRGPTDIVIIQLILADQAGSQQFQSLLFPPAQLPHAEPKIIGYLLLCELFHVPLVEEVIGAGKAGMRWYMLVRFERLNRGNQQVSERGSRVALVSQPQQTDQRAFAQLDRVVQAGQRLLKLM